ncbi:hypothetical protein A7M79_01285 [Acinetobacter baumannii]|uniref:hypothetical protein n=1 Tax=Acinetobacter baumannii TaxID=470 RepID=UPI0008DDE1D1|nr:hypothetical protein [Acinetobacter baumannii]OIH12149.1 hypothetical protein A7M79_01285 [Acinetobacter baumannii]
MKNIKNQKGTTLIIVLTIILLVSGLSAMGIKTILMSNKINSSQAVLTQLNKEASIPLTLLMDSDLIQQRRFSGDSGDAIFKYANDHKDQELVSCYLGEVGPDYFKPKNTELSLVALDENGRVHTINDNKVGFCDASKSYSSSRKNTITQVSIKYLGEGKNNDELYAINSISIMPKSLNRNSGSINEINSCLTENLNIVNSQNSTTVESCIEALKIPYKNFYAVLPIKKAQ